VETSAPLFERLKTWWHVLTALVFRGLEAQGILSLIVIFVQVTRFAAVYHGIYHPSKSHGMYIFIPTIRLQMVLESNWRSTWRCRLRELRVALGDRDRVNL